MRTRMTMLLLALCLPCGVLAQQPPTPPAPPAVPSVPAPPKAPQELGKWWKNSEIVKRLQITESQVKQIEQIFLEHRLKLVDLRAELERRELQLKPLMEIDQPDEAKVLAQTARIAAARAELEKANTSMMLAIRRVLSVEQWKKLEDIRDTRRLPAPPAPTAPPSPPAPPAPPKPVTDASSEDRVYEISDSIRPPIAAFQPVPSYTPEAREAKIEGIVILQMVIRKDGTVTDVKVVRGLGYGLDEAARDAIVNKWKFRPGTLNGRPVNVRAHAEVSFRLY